MVTQYVVITRGRIFNPTQWMTKSWLGIAQRGQERPWEVLCLAWEAAERHHVGRLGARKRPSWQTCLGRPLVVILGSEACRRVSYLLQELPGHDFLPFLYVSAPGLLPPFTAVKAELNLSLRDTSWSRSSSPDSFPCWPVLCCGNVSPDVLGCSA